MQKIQHLLWRSTFGIEVANIRNQMNITQQIDKLFEDSQNIIKISIDNEKDFAISELLPNRNASKEEKQELRKKSRQMIRSLNIEWIKTMRTTKAQLNEKMAFFWHGHFACQSQNFLHAKKYLETLRTNALGSFSTLLKAIAKEPAMLAFLNNQQNRKRSPNENFARELMELFTLGRGNYTEKDIKEAARAFTGWSFFNSQFVLREKQHDDGEKTFFGKK